MKLFRIAVLIIFSFRFNSTLPAEEKHLRRRLGMDTSPSKYEISSQHDQINTFQFVYDLLINRSGR